MEMRMKMKMVVMALVLVVFGDRNNNSIRWAMGESAMTLDMVRDWLVREEDTIIFSLIERAKYPLNSPTYNKSQAFVSASCGSSLFDFVAKETEAIQAKAGKFRNPEEHPFFPEDLPRPLVVPPYEFTSILHPIANSINVNDEIRKKYFNELLPSLALPGDDGNYAATASSDLNCLQAISRRIHYGNFVAEVKFRDDPQDYEPAIRAQDREALMRLLTFEAVEEAVKKRVEKKAATFSQEVVLNSTTEGEGKPKIEPGLVGRLYGDWIMPLTKDVEVEYLLRRLD